jgi:hypothetical protein
MLWIAFISLMASKCQLAFVQKTGSGMFGLTGGNSITWATWNLLHETDGCDKNTFFIGPMWTGHKV